MPKFIGAHVSIAGGVEQAPRHAAALGARAFAMFTKNQRQWSAPAYTADGCAGFAEGLRAGGFEARHVLPHASYLINLANPGAAANARAVDALVDELQRCRALGLDCLNLHPGSSLGQVSREDAVARVAGSVNRALARTEGVMVVLENTAGQGNTLGASFAELAAMLAGIHDASRAGICLDTAHLFAAGVDWRDAAVYAASLREFDGVVGLRRLRGLHLNDSKSSLGSRVDRHESLGAGRLGWAPFERIVRDARFDGLPLILETPDESLWPLEIRGLAEAGTR